MGDGFITVTRDVADGDSSFLAHLKGNVVEASA